MLYRPRRRQEGPTVRFNRHDVDISIGQVHLISGGAGVRLEPSNLRTVWRPRPPSRTRPLPAVRKARRAGDEVVRLRALIYAVSAVLISVVENAPDLMLGP